MAAVPKVETLVHQIQAYPGTWYAVIDVANAFFTIPVLHAAQDQFAFIWGGNQYTFTRLPQGYKHSPTFCHQVIHRTLICHVIPNEVQILQYIDDILIQDSILEQVQHELDAVTELLQQDGWAINSRKIQGPAQEVKYLGITWTQGIQQIPEKALSSIRTWPPQRIKHFLGTVGH